MRKTIAIAVGGTGGHVIPAGAIGKKLSNSARVIFLGVGLIKNPYFKIDNETVYDIDGGNFSKGLFQGVKKIGKGYLDAKKVLKREKVDHIVGWGSYHSLPAILAALELRIPYSLVVLDVFPGKVNRFFSRWAKQTAIHFDKAAESLPGSLTKMAYDLGRVPPAMSQQEARQFFGLHPDRKTLLIFGGSQGAEAINNAVLDAAKKLDGYQFIHFTGKETDAKERYQKMGIPAYVEPFSTSIDKAWLACDLTICRAGAGALREMLLFERPAIMIPFPGAMDHHQDLNALFMEKEIGGGVTLLQKNLTSELLLKTIRDSEKKLSSMRTSLHQYKNREERKDLTTIILESL